MSEVVEDKHVLMMARRRRIDGSGGTAAMQALMLEGWAAHGRVLPRNLRSTVDFILPGDIFPLSPQTNGSAVLTVTALTRVKIVPLDTASLQHLTTHIPATGRAAMDANMASQSRARERLVSLGQRSALERVAYLLCELFERLSRVGWTRGEWCGLPITQRDLGDALALTSIHVNRMLQELRRRNLIELANRDLFMLDLPELKRLALYEDTR